MEKITFTEKELFKNIEELVAEKSANWSNIPENQKIAVIGELKRHLIDDFYFKIDDKKIKYDGFNKTWNFKVEGEKLLIAKTIIKFKYFDYLGKFTKSINDYSYKGVSLSLIFKKNEENKICLILKYKELIN